MGPLGMGEVVVLFVLALLIFGPKKLPELGKTFGKGMAEFKRASNELKTTFKREMDNIEYEARDVKAIASDVGQDVNASYYDDSEDDYYSGYDYSGGSSAASTTASSKNGDAADGDAAPAEAAGDEAAGNGASESAPSGEASAVTAEAAPKPVSGVPEA